MVTNMSRFLTTIKDEFIDAFADIKDFFIGIYDTIFNFLAKMFGEQFATITLIGIGFVILMIVLIKLMNR